MSSDKYFVLCRIMKANFFSHLTQNGVGQEALKVRFSVQLE